MIAPNPKIGFYGGMANNAYVAAKQVREHGHDIIYIRDESDLFPFSQAVWEDCAFVLPYDDIHNTRWDRALWAKLEQEQGWEQPEWFVAPSVVPSKTPLHKSRGLVDWALKNFLYHAYVKRAPHRLNVVRLMQQCDALFVCGVEADILGWYSGVPYVIQPHGGDIRLAAGLVPFQGKGMRAFLSYWITRFFTNWSYKSCLWVGIHDPKGVAGDLGTVHYQLEHLPLPIKSRKLDMTQEQRHQDLARIMTEMGIDLPQADFYFFVPSRIDFYWKKTDALIAAIQKLGKTARCHVIFAGWGVDYHKAKEMLPPGLVTFLPHSISKPLLYRMFQSVDLVVDQFVLGTYGTSAIEAIGCGTPVMMYIEEQAFLNRGWPPPPVINVRTEQEIYQSLQSIMDGTTKLPDIGQKLYAWFMNTHDDRKVVPEFFKKLNIRMKEKAEGSSKYSEQNTLGLPRKELTL